MVIDTCGLLRQKCFLSDSLKGSMFTNFRLNLLLYFLDKSSFSCLSSLLWKMFWLAYWWIGAICLRTNRVRVYHWWKLECLEYLIKCKTNPKHAVIYTHINLTINLLLQQLKCAVAINDLILFSALNHTIFNVYLSLLPFGVNNLFYFTWRYFILITSLCPSYLLAFLHSFHPIFYG